MKSIGSAFTRLARSFDAGVSTRVRMIRKSDGWEVDLTDLCGANWVRGVRLKESLDVNTASFTIDLTRSIGENTINPLRASKANRCEGVADPVLAVKRLVVVDVQVVPPEGVADADNWVELVRGYVDRVGIANESNTITLECRDESSRFIDRWQEYERNWPSTIPDDLEDVIQALLDTATYDPGPRWFGIVYSVGDLRRPLEHDGYLYRCTTAGTSHATTTPTWNTTPGATTTDGTATWTNVGPLPAPAWSAGATKYLGSIIRPTTRNGYMYQCTAVTGAAPYTTHATTEPTWPTTYGGTVVDNELTWTLIEDMPDLYTPTTPGWAVTRAAADDYGVPPQAYWAIVRAFVDQIGWDCRFAWVSGSSRRRPVLRTGSPQDYNTLGDAGTFEASQYEITSDVEFSGEGIRNIVEVVYFDGDEDGPRTKTSYRVENTESIAAYGPQFCQLTMDSAGLINDAFEAQQLATAALNALRKPVAILSVRVPFFPWIDPGDGIKLTPRPEDALFDSIADTDGTFVAMVDSVSHSTEGGVGTTDLQLRAFFTPSSDVEQDQVPVRRKSWLNKEARAKLGVPPTRQRPGDVVAHIYAGSAQGPSSAGAKPGLAIDFGSTTRDIAGNVTSGVFEAPVGGLYSITASVTVDVAPAAGSEMFLSVVSGGSYVLQVARPIGTAEAGAQFTISVSGLVLLADGDSIAVYVSCNPSANITTVAGAQKTFVSARLVR